MRAPVPKTKMSLQKTGQLLLVVALLDCARKSAMALMRVSSAAGELANLRMSELFCLRAPHSANSASLSLR